MSKSPLLATADALLRIATADTLSPHIEAELIDSAATLRWAHDELTRERVRFAEHPEAWQKNSETSAQRIDALRKALDDLYSVQNGCPLPKYQQDWDAAMLAAGRLLGYRR